jgi:hypothetical protein
MSTTRVLPWQLCLRWLQETGGGLNMEKIQIQQHSFVGSLWFAAWLFTLGLLHLPFWKGVVAIVAWPYYLGAAFTALLPH